MNSEAICGGNHEGKNWTEQEINEHLEKMDGSCLDCYCGTPFKKAGDKK